MQWDSAMPRPGAARRWSALFMVSALVVALVGDSGATLAAAGEPAVIVFVGEVASAPSYDHIGVVFDKRLDERVPVPFDDFVVTIDNTPYVPIAGSYEFSGLAGSGGPFDVSGTTIVRLDLPVGVTISPGSTLQVDYSQGGAPLRDLSLTPPLTPQSVPGGVVDFGGVGFLGAMIDAANATNRLTLLFTGQLDLDLIPAPDDFAVTVDGSPDAVTQVEPRFTDIGLGIVDLLLTTPVQNGAVVAFTYTPDLGGNRFTARNGGFVLDGFSQTEVTLFIPPTTASATLAANDTLATATGSPTPEDPLITAVTSPTAGLVTIAEVTVDPSPAGYTFFGEQVVISAPAATDPADPLLLTFNLDASLVPAGENAQSIVILRTALSSTQVVPECDAVAPAAPAASPSPCVWDRTDQVGGGISITVATLQASKWNFGRPTLATRFDGFRAPVDRAPTRNAMKAGTAVPLKFSLGGDRSLAIFATGSPSSQMVTCDTSTPIDGIEQTVTAGGSSLTYDAASDTYTYIWKTQKEWTGCRKLTLTFVDGSAQEAIFQFR
jgi:uncharacterized repeat protein (TIGR02059 family)